ncbi:MAG: fimbrillin family protein [Dysgonamonadaceae bacterium]|jgi:hypothetical protein|nr:fimbrillin family protein [Dysgonamonadaceae bacterium]
MKRFYFTVNMLCVLLPSFFLSCEGDLIDPSGVSRKALINAQVENTQTRASNNTWSNNDSIGIYMKKAGEALSSSSVLADNVKYVTGGTSSFSAANDDEAILFPFSGSSVDFIGYYPFKRLVSNFIYPVDVSVQTNQEAIDLLYSNNSSGLNTKEPFVNMIFVHQLSKIRLNIHAENGVSLAGIAVKLTNTETTASFDLSSGALSSYASVKDVSFFTAADGSYAEAILLPTSNFSNKDMVLTIGELTYVYPLSGSSSITSFEKSTQYTYNISLNPGEGSIAVASGDITNWVNGASDDLSLSPTTDYTDNGKGKSKDNPFTVEEAIQNQNSNEVWVKGYIIGYFSSTTKSSFTTSMDDGSAISQSNFVISSNVNETSVNNANTLSVSVPTSTKIRPYINLKDNPQLLKTEILLKGNLTAYFSMPGIKDITTVVIDGVEYPK